VSVKLSANGEKKVQKSVTVYTTPTCTWCNTIKRHFQENGIRYHEVDVSKDQKAAEGNGADEAVSRECLKPI
jgi:hypothetical protein